MSKQNEAVGIIYYDEDTGMFPVVLNFEDGRCLTSVGTDVIEAVKHSVKRVQSQFTPDFVDTLVSMRDQLLEEGRAFDIGVPFSDDFDPEELRNLLIQYHIAAIVPKDEIDKWDLLFVKAFNFMAKKHFGQKDKAGMDYFFHPTSVSHDLEPKASVVAILHDVLEDTDASAKDLKGLGCPKDVVDAVIALTRRYGESYRDYILRVDRNELASAVKFEDLEDNMNLTRLQEVTERDLPRLNKYLHAWRYLHGHDDDLALIPD